MQLNDLIEEQSIPSIAKKTNISEEVIVKLFDREFRTMKLAQAMGAVRIIEREYQVDLDSLRQECQAYFGDHHSEESGLVNIGCVKKKKTIFPKLLAAFLLILLAYGAWYFFIGYYKQKVNPLDSQSVASLVDTILGREDVAAQETSEQSVEHKSPKKIEAQKTIAEKAVALEPKESAVADNLEDNSDAVKVIVVEASVAEQNESSQQVAGESNASTEETPIAMVQKTMVLLPQKEMWFRLTNLDNKEKREFRREDRYEIDLKDNNWLFATENALFAFINNDFFEEFGGAGKLFFRLDQEGIHQLSEDEYRAASK